MPGDEPQQPGDRGVGDDEADQCADGELAPADDGGVDVLEREQAGAGQRRDGQEERQPGRGHPVDALEQPGGDRRPGPRDPGDQGDALDQTDDQHLAQGEVGLADALGRTALGDVHHRAPADQAAATTHRLRSGPSIRFCRARATITIGVDPAMTYQAKR